MIAKNSSSLEESLENQDNPKSGHFSFLLTTGILAAIGLNAPLSAGFLAGSGHDVGFVRPALSILPPAFCGFLGYVTPYRKADAIARSVKYSLACAAAEAIFFTVGYAAACASR